MSYELSWNRDSGSAEADGKFGLFTEKPTLSFQYTRLMYDSDTVQFYSHENKVHMMDDAQKEECRQVAIALATQEGGGGGDLSIAEVLAVTDPRYREWFDAKGSSAAVLSSLTQELAKMKAIVVDTEQALNTLFPPADNEGRVAYVISNKLWYLSTDNAWKASLEAGMNIRLKGLESRFEEVLAGTDFDETKPFGKTGFFYVDKSQGGTPESESGWLLVLSSEGNEYQQFTIQGSGKEYFKTFIGGTPSGWVNRHKSMAHLTSGNTEEYNEIEFEGATATCTDSKLKVKINDQKLSVLNASDLTVGSTKKLKFTGDVTTTMSGDVVTVAVDAGSSITEAKVQEIANAAVSSHNTSEAAHQHIQSLIGAQQTRINQVETASTQGDSALDTKIEATKARLSALESTASTGGARFSVVAPNDEIRKCDYIKFGRGEVIWHANGALYNAPESTSGGGNTETTLLLYSGGTTGFNRCRVVETKYKYGTGDRYNVDIYIRLPVASSNTSYTDLYTTFNGLSSIIPDSYNLVGVNITAFIDGVFQNGSPSGPYVKVKNNSNQASMSGKIQYMCLTGVGSAITWFDVHLKYWK